MRGLGRSGRAAAILIALSTFVPGGARAQVAAPAAPPLLSLTGLYVEGSVPEIDPSNLPFSPQYPLWSDGAGKSRWVHLPEGATIDGADADAWVLPVGTKLWKEFAWEGRKIETRFIWRASEKDWVFAAYLWKEDQSDALLAAADGIPDYNEIAPGKRHSIPGVLDCRTCHEGSRAKVLGFSALQLSPDRDPMAPHAEPLEPGMVTLDALLERGILVGSRDDLLKHPPRVPGRTPRERAILGYLSANCGGCHNPEGALQFLGLYLRQPAAPGAPSPAAQTAIGIASRFTLPGAAPDETLRIAPGDPARSSILYRISSRRPSSQMPPLGTALVDREAIELMRGWIAEDLPAKR